jgi:predicted MFS family arabinose efflux permease
MQGSKSILLILPTLLISTSLGTANVIAPAAFAYQIIRDLRISYVEMGFLISAPSISAMPASIVIGILIDRIDPRRMLAASLAAISISTMVISIAQSYLLFMFLRLIAGIFMASIWPSCAKIVARDVPLKLQGISTTAYDLGSLIGLSIAYILVSQFEERWRNALFIVSLCGFLASLTNVTIYRNQEDMQVARKTNNIVVKYIIIDHKKLIKSSIQVAVAIYLVLTSWFFLVSWASTYLAEELGFREVDLALLALLTLFLGSLTSIASGLISDRIVGLRGVKVLLIPSIAITSASLLLLSQGYLPTISFLASISSFRFGAPLLWLAIIRAYPYEVVGKIGGIAGIAIQASALTLPTILGFIKEITGSFKPGLLLISILSALSIPLYASLKSKSKV